MHESEQRRRLLPPAALAAPPALPRLFPQPAPSPQSPSSLTSLCRVLDCKVANPPFALGRVIGQKRIDQLLVRAPSRTQPAPSAGCALHGAVDEKGELGARPGLDIPAPPVRNLASPHPIISSDLCREATGRIAPKSCLYRRHSPGGKTHTWLQEPPPLTRHMATDDARR